MERDEGVDEVSEGRPVGSRSLFFHDLRWSVSCWGSAPLFVALAVAFQMAVPAVAGTDANVCILVLLPCWAGFLGTERIFYLRAYAGYRLEWREVPSLTLRFLGPFLGLGLLILIPELVFVAALALARRMRGAAHVHHPLAALTGWERGTLVAVVLLIDVLFTFVVPALTFTTRSPVEALRLGLAMLRATWPISAWYILAPGITLAAISVALPSSVIGYGGRVALAGGTGLIAFALRGSVVPFYLQRRPHVGLSGSVTP